MRGVDWAGLGLAVVVLGVTCAAWVIVAMNL